jgi:hypothetical protein
MGRTEVDMERFDLKKLNDLEIREKFTLKSETGLYLW